MRGLLIRVTSYPAKNQLSTGTGTNRRTSARGWIWPTLLAAGLLFTNTYTEAQDLQSVSVQLPWKHQFQFAGYYAAIEKGFYAEAGLEVDLREWTPGVTPVEEVAGGRAQYGVARAEILYHRLQGNPVVALASIFQHSPVILLAKPQTGIRSPQDMIGRKVALGRVRENAETYAMLLKEGVSPESLVSVAPSYDLDNFINNRVEVIPAYLTYQPFHLYQAGVPFTVIRPITYGIDFYGDCLFTSEQELKKNPKRAAAFRRASLRGWEYAFEEVEEIINLILTEYSGIQRGLSTELLRFEAEEMRKLILPELVEIGHMNPGRWEHIAGTFVSLGMTAPDYSLQGFLYDPNPPRFNWNHWSLKLLLGLMLLSVSLIPALYYRKLKVEIAQRKKAQEELKAGEEKYRLLVETQTDLVVKSDPQGRLLFVSPAYCKTFGKTEKELLDRKFMPLIKPEDQEAVAASMATLPNPPDRTRHEERAMTAEGWRWFEWNCQAVINEQGEVQSVVSVGRDITERKKATEEYATILHTTMDGFWIVDTRGCFLEVNEAYCRMIGYNREELLHMGIRDIEAIEEEEDTRKHIRKIMEIGHDRFETRHRGKDGRIIDVEVSTNYMEGDEGKLFVFLRDISERKELEKQVLQSQKMESVGRLAGGIAHDFNNLLTVITGNAELALMETDVKVREEIEEIKSTAERAAHLTNQLLIFSRHQVVQPRIINLNDTLIDLDRMLRHLIGEHIEYVTVPTEELLTVNADPGQITQVLTNLVVNAQDAMPKGGRLTIETENVTLREESRSRPGMEGGDYVAMRVSDTGIGMDQETMSHIFEPFFTTKGVEKGTGLGLSTCYGIIKQAGGYILASSEPGQGSIITIYLPRADGQSATKTQSEDGEQKALQGSETLLVVEDESVLRNLLRRILGNYGYTVIEAANGEEALQQLEQHQGEVHLLITDMVMPTMGGEELVERLKRSGKELKVLFMSGYTDTPVTEKHLVEPGLAFIQKPYTPNEILQKVRQVLDKI